jgi:hypothetical protein
MDKDKTYIGRKRTVFIEKISYPKISENTLSKTFGLPLFFNMDFLRKNRFLIEMQIDEKPINNDNIQGFSIVHIDEKESSIKINTVLHVNDWIDNYEKVNIIKVYLLDGLGNIHKNFDFDVVFKGYTFDCDYKDDAPVNPYFLYKII